MGEPLQQFGGTWTDLKLESLRKYLVAYQTALKNQPFNLYYVDAFAGTGYNSLKAEKEESLLQHLNEPETRKFIAGSARIALQISPPFDHYIFIERDAARYSELLKLKEQFPSLAGRIQPIQDEANHYLTALCRGRDWMSEQSRGVVFLDPFGMQVSWSTLQAIAETRAIDLWLLFPLGIGVMRMLPNHGNFPKGWRDRLDKMFGEPGWYEAFYSRQEHLDLFGDLSEVTVKNANYQSIGNYFVQRLKSIFPYVAEKPLALLNSSHCPLYLLCFAAANPEKGGKMALRIAQHILKS